MIIAASFPLYYDHLEATEAALDPEPHTYRHQTLRG
jgi:hypothetical protein